MNRLETAWEKSFTDRGYRVGLHMLFWILYICVFKTAGFIIGNSMTADYHFFDFYSLVNLVISNFFIIVIYYLTIRTVYHSIVYNKRYNLGLLYLVLCIIVYLNAMFLANELILRIMKARHYPIPSFDNYLFQHVEGGYVVFITNGVIMVELGFSFFLYIGIPIFCKFFRDRLRSQKSQAALEKQNVQLQMDFIKMQIHPHFLFNTLNNIYSLITHHETGKSAEMVSGLSALLRYALYDGKTEFISLAKELGMLKHYIGLEEVRSDSIRLEVLVPDRVPDANMPPFLLLPLVENAFKHGVNNQLEQSCVKIEIVASAERLILQVLNSYDSGYRKKNAGGLGLTNLKKRLDYYYDGHYILDTHEDGHIFNAKLEIPLCPKSAV